MIIASTLLIIFTLALSFINTQRIRHTFIVSWFVVLCWLVLSVSPNHFESIVMILGIFLPFLGHFLSQGVNQEQPTFFKRSGIYQSVVILISTMLGSSILLQVYKKREFIDSLWVAEQLKNRTIYEFMSQYYDMALFIAAIVVIGTTLVCKRITEGQAS